jgi:energy-coupling factor transport system ATP-binding protein
MQRMAFAGVLVSSPNLLLLDEPTSMLDPESAASVRDTVEAQLNQTGAALIVVEHRFSDWLDLVDRILVLNNHGELILDDQPSKLLAEHREQLEDLGIWVPGLANPTPDAVALGAFDGGKVTVLAGPSGAGKTTELKRRMREDPHSTAIQLGVGYVPQQAELTILGNTVFESAHFTAEHATFGLTIDKDVALERTRAALRALRVAELAEVNPYEV